MADDDTVKPAFLVNGFTIGQADIGDPSKAVLRLSGSREGPHFHFAIDAEVMDRLGDALKDSARKLRKTAN